MKENYRIPTSLGESAFDVEVALTGKSGMGLRPMPVGYILVWMGSALGLMWAVSSTFVSASPLGLKAVFCLLWVLVTFLVLRRDELGHQMWAYIPAAANYLSRRMRTLGCRRTQQAGDLRSLVGIASVETSGRCDGRIRFVDGSFGYVFEVVGNGSRLLFEADKAAIVDRYDGFWRKMDADCSYSIVSCKAPMRVDSQLGAMVRRWRRTDDEALAALIDEKYKVLREHVGSEFRSTHQYIVARADSREGLRRCVTHIQGECENSSLVFKRVERLGGRQALAVLHDVYCGLSRREGGERR